MVMFRESSVSIGNLRLNRMVGAASGPPLLLLHGVLRRWQTFHPLWPHLAARWQLHGLDFPGHGASDRLPGDYRVIDYVRVTTDFVSQQLDEPLIIYGHSLGAMVAAGVASQLGERVTAVILEDPPLDTMGPRIRETALHGYFQSLQRWAGSQVPRDQIARELAEITVTDPVTLVTLRLGDMRDAAQLRFMASCLAQLDPQVLEPIVQCCWLEGFDWRQIFQNLACPALLLQADTAVAGMLTDGDAAELARLTRSLTLVKVSGCGHNMHWTRTQDVANLTCAFLESL
jgi:pimeloyl-ACP methyl ester carboxylesterase